MPGKTRGDCDRRGNRRSAGSAPGRKVCAIFFDPPAPTHAVQCTASTGRGSLHRGRAGGSGGEHDVLPSRWCPAGDPGSLLLRTAQGGSAAGRPGQAPVAAPRAIECHCRANGRAYELGDRVCLPTPSGQRVAECRMVQNVTSWSFGGEDCSVSASLTLFQQGAAPTRPTRLNSPVTSDRHPRQRFLAPGGVGPWTIAASPPDCRHPATPAISLLVLAGINRGTRPFWRGALPAERTDELRRLGIELAAVGGLASTGNHDQPRWPRPQDASVN